MRNIKSFSRAVGALGACGVLALSSAACSPAKMAHDAHRIQASIPSTAPAPPPGPPIPPAAPAGPSHLVVAQGHGWTPAGLQGPQSPPGACHVAWGIFQGQRQPLPDLSCTPGAIDPAVTQADLQQTICRPGGYTTTVRPPENLTEQAKRQSVAAYGNYAGSSATPYELDHLVPLTLGGASATQNLWVEQNIGGTGGAIINAKDHVEDDVGHAVCAGKVSLAAAQNAIATNWTTAEQTLGVPFGSGGNGPGGQS